MKPEDVVTMADGWMCDISTTTTHTLEEVKVSIYHQYIRVMY